MTKLRGDDKKGAGMTKSAGTASKGTPSPQDIGSEVGSHQPAPRLSDKAGAGGAWQIVMVRHTADFAKTVVLQ